MPGQVQGIIAQARLQRGLGLSGMPVGAFGTPAPGGAAPGGAGIRPGSPAVTPGATLLPGGLRNSSPMPGDGLAPGAEGATVSGPDSATTTPAPPGVDMPATKRRKRGFSDGPLMPGMAMPGEMMTPMDGPQQGWPQGVPPHGATRYDMISLSIPRVPWHSSVHFIANQMCSRSWGHAADADRKQRCEVSCSVGQMACCAMC
jgi:hypothetical protein